MNRKNFLKILSAKKIETFFILLWIYALFFDILADRSGDPDIFWNYDYSHFLISGMKPYADYGFAASPFFVYLYAIPLLIKDDLYIHTLNAIPEILCLTGIYYAIFKKLLKKSKVHSFAVACFFSVIFPSFQISPNYNTLCTILFLTAFALWLYVPKYSVKTTCLSGLLCSVAFFNKPNIGLYMALAVLAAIIYSKAGVKKLITFALSGVIFTLAGFTFIYSQGYFDQYLTHILSTGDFPVSFIDTVLAIVIYSGLTAVEVSIIRKKQKQILTRIFIFSAFMKLGIWPEPNSAHVFHCISFTAFLFLYCLEEGELRKSTDAAEKRKDKTAVTVCCIAALIFFVMSPVCIITRSSNVREETDQIIEYMKDHPGKYYIIDRCAMRVRYYSGKNEFYKFYDLFYDGSMVNSDAVSLVQEADCDYFIMNREKCDRQINKDAYEMIKNMNEIDMIDGRIDTYGVYENPNCKN